jgi:glutamine amidotransferase|tara:strand:- start:1952 stop:2560 length:609 start_codon:yes stop_codon:yes gene_type:complete
MVKVCILDYDSGNTKSVENIFEKLNINYCLSNSKKDIISSTHLVLSGVGSYSTVMKKINENLPLDILTDEVLNKSKPILGICVGMQIMSEIGYEFEKTHGLGWIEGKVKQIESKSLPLPHIGWNEIIKNSKSSIVDKIKDGECFYFVNSFCFETIDKYVVAYTNYGSKFPAIIQNKNILGVQFHPEKSQKSGQKIIKNFLIM